MHPQRGLGQRPIFPLQREILIVTVNESKKTHYISRWIQRKQRSVFSLLCEAQEKAWYL
jgi:hypothetical protein